VKLERLGIYPGTFDPVTYGHIDVVRRSLSLFDRVVVAVAVDSPKRCLFTAQERYSMVEKVFRGCPEVTVEVFQGLLVNFVKKKGARSIIRGLRAISDFEYEFQMATTNRVMYPRAETIFLLPRAEFFYISSSLIKEIARFGGDVSSFVPPHVARALTRKFSLSEIRRMNHAQSQKKAF